MQPQQCPLSAGPLQGCQQAASRRRNRARCVAPSGLSDGAGCMQPARPGAHRYPPKALRGLSYGCAAPAAAGPAPCGAAGGGSGCSCSRAAPARRAGAGRPAAPTAANSSSCSAGPALPEPWPRSAQRQPARRGLALAGECTSPLLPWAPTAPCAPGQGPVAVAGHAQDDQCERCSSFSGEEATARCGQQCQRSDSRWQRQPQRRRQGPARGAARAALATPRDHAGAARRPGGLRQAARHPAGGGAGAPAWRRWRPGLW